MDQNPPRGRRGPPRTAPRDERGNIVPRKKRELKLATAAARGFGRDDTNIPANIDAPIEGLPPKRVDGKPNASYYAALLGWLNDAQARSIKDNGYGIRDFEATQKSILAEGKVNGFDPDAVVDNRPESVKLREVASMFLNGDFPMLEMRDEELAALDRLMIAAIDDIEKDIEATVKKHQGDYDSEERTRRLAARLQQGKAWRDRIAKVKRLKDLARNPIPKCLSHRENHIQRHAMSASRLLRYMLYTMRTNLSSQQATGGTASFIQISHHHRKMALGAYKAHHSYDITKDGFVKRAKRTTGLMFIVPPGHSKTTMVIAIIADALSENPYLKVLISHAKELNASDNLVYLTAFFQTDSPTGRRNHALYENLPPVKEATKFRMILQTDEQSRSPTVSANGATAKVGGVDADILWEDDVVDVAERDSETLRDSKKQAVNALGDRLRDSNTSFRYVSATAWHEDDANMARVKMIYDGKLDMHLVKMGCGGPSGVPQFAPLWPEMYPASYLRTKYEMDPLLYSATYMSNPRSEELQIVKKLRFYDPSTETHKEFLNGSINYLSVDPAATAREKSDKAGIIYAGLGDVSDGERSERRLRIYDARQITADPEGAKQFIYGFAFGHKVDYVAIEEVGFSGSMRVAINNELGIDCIPCPTMSKSKELRLKAVAPLLEDKRHSEAHGGAVVEFPGVRNQHGTLVCDPQFEWLARQFYRFGSIKDDHGLDAVNQLVAYLTRTGELQAGTGFVTDKVREAVLDGDPRIRAALAACEKPKHTDTVEMEDWKFMSSLSQN